MRNPPVLVRPPEPRPQGARQDNDQHQATATTQSAAKTVGPAPSGFNYALWGKVGVFSGAGIAALGGVFTYMASKAADDYKGAADAKGLRDAKGNFNTYNGTAVGCYIAGGAIAATGAVLWILSAGEQPKGQATMIQPVVAPGAGGIVVMGSW